MRSRLMLTSWKHIIGEIYSSLVISLSLCKCDHIKCIHITNVLNCMFVHNSENLAEIIVFPYDIICVMILGTLGLGFNIFCQHWLCRIKSLRPFWSEICCKKILLRYLNHFWADFFKGRMYTGYLFVNACPALFISRTYHRKH